MSTNRDKSTEPERPSPEETPANGRDVTDAEREDLIEDAKTFRELHEETFNLLSESVD